MFTNFIEKIKTAEITNDEKLNILILFFNVAYYRENKNPIENLSNLIYAIKITNLSTMEQIKILSLLHKFIKNEL
jgi:hypothetical protein